MQMMMGGNNIKTKTSSPPTKPTAPSLSRRDETRVAFSWPTLSPLLSSPPTPVPDRTPSGIDGLGFRVWLWGRGCLWRSDVGLCLPIALASACLGGGAVQSS
ncbi:hypothetical protein P167DRAFT_59684 [Morchella conica CCBAS932]|uniref:Uncharacterized protein n=1 Tax=Morchella conica CCBAS932 TaxID=1392247 RepID=A0A3N4KZ17_9PEZI|nr:hypothetical protein P167DRAFT_59684 [Morchella conica CCBAS932]